MIGSPSFRGYTGLAKIPTAQTLDRGEFSFGVTTEDTTNQDPDNAFATYSPRDNVEIGLDSYLPPGLHSRKTLVNAKYRCLQGDDKIPGIAVGFIDMTNELQGTAYAVATKSLFRRASIFNSFISVRGNAGFGVGDIDGFFAGLSLYAGNRVMFSAEWDSEDVNLGFRFTPVKGFRLHAAMFDVGNLDHFGVGMSFTKTY